MATTDTMPRSAEVTEAHTRILRLALGVEDSRAYWAHLDPSVPTGPRAIQAFEQRWFGGKSLERVRTLLANFSVRYDTFAEALTVLRRWTDMDRPTRQLVCHWHLQLTDPIYRRFTGEFLVLRREAFKPEFDRNVVTRWVTATYPERWSSATVIQFASKLLSATSEAGLITPKRDPRRPVVPRVSDAALEYMLYLLRGVQFQGSLTDNPYFASVGLDRETLTPRLSALPSITYWRVANVDDFGWKYPSLSAWAEATR
jgi:hypothetical protein